MNKKNYTRPHHYREQDGCHNCDKVCCIIEHDVQHQFFCNRTRKKQPRPKSGSVLMGEGFASDLPEGSTEDDYDKVWEEERAAWRRWSIPKKVEPYGICEEWKYRTWVVVA